MKEIIRTLKPYIPEEPAEAVKERLGVERLVRLSANENPYGTSPLVREAILSYVTHNDANYYPDGNASDLRMKLAGYWQVEPEQLVIGVGLDEVIAMVNKTLITAGDSIVVSVPAFSEYALNGLVEGAEIREVPADFETGQYDFSALVKAVDETTRLVWICNPNNPTGTYESVEDIRKFVAAIPKETLVIVDEAYIDFTDMASAVTLQKTYQNVVVLQTLSKAWGLAGLRVGICVADPELVIYLNKVKPPYNIGSLTQRRALDVLRNDADFLEKVETIKRERKRVTGVLRDLSWLEVVCDSEANFVLIRCERFRELYEYLVEGGVIVRVRHIPPRLSCGLRITVGTREENDLLIERLKKFGDL